MAVAYDTAGSGSSGSATTMSWTHSAATSTNSAAVAFVSWTGTGFSTCSATYNGVQMKLLASVQFGGSGSISRVMTFGIMNPPTGSQTVSVNVTATTTSVFKGNTISFTGVGWIGDAATAYGATGTTMSMSASSFKGMIAQIFANADTAAISGYTGGGTGVNNANSGNQTVYGYATGSDVPNVFSATQSNNIAWAGIAVPIRSTDKINGVSSEINSSGTFNVPSGSVGCYVTLVGAGGGGGGGTTPSAGSGNGGGAGGGGGYLGRTFVSSELLGSTYTVTRGAGGTAGPLGNTVGATDGGNGGDSSFSTGTISLIAPGGRGGLGGANATPTGGGGGGANGTNNGTNSFTTTGVTASSVEAGAAGGRGGYTGNLVGVAGSNSSNAGAGGGGGGANISSANAGGAGGTSTGAVTGGTAASGGSGAAGGLGSSAIANGFGGAGGGGGGGGTALTNGGVGGAGGIYGGGAGGGGGKQGSNASGAAGGVGGVGYTKVEWLYGDNNFMNYFQM